VATHIYCCGVLANARYLHGLFCKQASSTIARHQQLNDLVTQAVLSAVIPTTKQLPLASLICQDGKRTDRITQTATGSGEYSIAVSLQC